ncbi:Tfp pilus assembly protein FimT/FimU [Synechococcus sp. NOUM97013]|uniref:pilus assembly FimT family protein n=1 Tax=Synechococcus sp. NOUM97013 TaxID=1442555 RepID=UPI0016464B7B|nr:type II secretion system protein [Synechococcus sp. NOUM97013]
MRQHSAGFTLLELIAGGALVAMGVSAVMPSLFRNMRQGEVDRYTQQLETGLFSLRAKLGQQKTSCTLKFEGAELTTFKSPKDLLEMKTHPERIECCNSDIKAANQAKNIDSGCTSGPNVGSLLAENLSGIEKDRVIRDRSLRLIEQEGTSISDAVEVAVNLENYELTPPGTSTMSDDLIFLIRSKESDQSKLRTRCLQISGTGTIFSASWNDTQSRCEK